MIENHRYDSRGSTHVTSDKMEIDNHTSDVANDVEDSHSAVSSV